MANNFHISHSGLRAFQTCPRKYTYLYHDKREANRDSRALRLGSFIHRALEEWWNDSPEAALRWCSEHSNDIEPADAAKAAAMLHHYNPPRDDYEVIATEVPFSIMVRNPDTGRAMRSVRLNGFVDGLLRDKATGELVVLEHKTTSEQIIGFDAFWAKLSVDAQIGIYAVAFNASKVAYDVLKKPGLRPSGVDRKACAEYMKQARISRDMTETDVLDHYAARVAQAIQGEAEVYYQFRVIPFAEADLERARRNIFESVGRLRLSRRDHVFPQHSGSCRSLFGLCDFLDVCAGRADLADDALFRDRVRS